jgi:hypothetical protein
MASYGSHLQSSGPALHMKSESIESLQVYDARRDMEQYWRNHLRRIYKDERAAAHKTRLETAHITSSNDLEDIHDDEHPPATLTRCESDLVYTKPEKSPSLSRTIFAGSFKYIVHKIQRHVGTSSSSSLSS